MGVKIDHPSMIMPWPTRFSAPPLTLAPLFFRARKPVERNIWITTEQEG
jgi:hypothetical protein